MYFISLGGFGTRPYMKLMVIFIVRIRGSMKVGEC